jgi:hypothetical protein
MAELGALAIRTDTELLLKSRRAVPRLLTAAGFEFRHGTWPESPTTLSGVRGGVTPKDYAGGGRQDQGAWRQWGAKTGKLSVGAVVRVKEKAERGRGLNGNRHSEVVQRG